MDTNPYNSGNGMQTHVWGPVQWLMLHIMSFNYPVKPTIKQKIHYWDYLLALKNVLPCRHCRENMQSNLYKAKIQYHVFDNRDTFSKFIFDFHNEVNLAIKGKKWDKGYTYLQKQIECIRARCSNHQQKQETAGKPKEKGCTEPVVLGCPAAAEIVLKRKEPGDKSSIEFRFGKVLLANASANPLLTSASAKT